MRLAIQDIKPEWFHQPSKCIDMRGPTSFEWYLPYETYEYKLRYKRSGDPGTLISDAYPNDEGYQHIDANGFEKINPDEFLTMEESAKLNVANYRSPYGWYVKDDKWFIEDKMVGGQCVFNAYKKDARRNLEFLEKKQKYSGVTFRSKGVVSADQFYPPKVCLQIQLVYGCDSDVAFYSRYDAEKNLIIFDEIVIMERSRWRREYNLALRSPAFYRDDIESGDVVFASKRDETSLTDNGNAFFYFEDRRYTEEIKKGNIGIY